MPLLTSVSYDPTLKTVTVAGDISTAALTSIINQTRGKDLFVVGQTPVTNRVFGDGNTTFTLDTDTSGDNVSDVLSVRYQSNSADYATAAQGTKADNSVQLTGDQTVKGIKIFEEKLILPNCVLINGVADFRQNTKPTQRTFLVNDVIVTEPLVIGDKWYNTTEKIDCIFEGINWIGPQIEILRSGATSLVNGAIHTLTGVPLIQEQSNNIFVKSLSAIVQLTSGGTYNGSNYWRIGPVFETNNALGLAQGTFPLPITYHNITSYAPFIEVTTTINSYLNDNLQLANLRLWTSSVGSPATTQWVGGRFIYHRVY